MRAVFKKHLGTPAGCFGGVVCMITAFSGFGTQRALAQPEEIRIRALGVSSTTNRAEAVDLLGSQGIVIRDHLPGRFSTEFARCVGDVNGDGLSDLGIFWGAIGSVTFEVFYVIYGHANPPQQIDVSTIATVSTRFRQTRIADDFCQDPTVMPAGDLDGDGFDDFFICDEGHSLDSGAHHGPGIAYLVYGAPDIPSDCDLSDPPANMRVVCFASGKTKNVTKGDANGDGIMDLAFGSPWARVNDISAGAVHVLLGREEPYAGVIDLEQAGSELPGYILHGDVKADGFGRAVRYVGDVDGDTFEDLLIEVSGTDGSGYAILFYGRTTRPPRLSSSEILNGGHGVRFLREGDLSQLNDTIAAFGDVNGDMYADFVIGAEGEPVGGGPAGVAYAVFGAPHFDRDTRLSTLAAFGGAIRFLGVDNGDMDPGNGVGSSLAAMDYDADGVLDLLIGSARDSPNGISWVGQVYIVNRPFEAGSGSWRVDAIRGGALEGALFTGEVPEWSGYSTQPAGDMNGDGLQDVLVAAPYWFPRPHTVEPGLSPDPSLYVVFGSGGRALPLRVDEVSPAVGPLAGLTEVTLLGQGFQDDVDIQFDGQSARVLQVETSARAVVEVPRGKTVGQSVITVVRDGQTVRAEGLFRYIDPFFPDIDVHDPEAGLEIEAGSGRAAALDHDGDWFGDVVVDSEDGLVLVYGREPLPDGSLISVAPGTDALPEGTARLRYSSQLKHEPFAVGDVNGDGVADLAIVSQVIVTVLFGGDRFHGSVEIDNMLENGNVSVILLSGFDRGRGVAGGHDMNGDQIGDLILYRPGGVNVVRGRTAWPSLRGLTGEPQFLSFVTDSRFGVSAALPGDIDGDRFSEVLIGAPGQFYSDRGKGYVVFGKADWGTEDVDSLVGFGDLAEIDSVKEKDSLGITVTAVGDFDGDGRPDLALGALGGSLGLAGECYVVFGGGDLREGQALGLLDLGNRGVRIKGEFGYDYAVGMAPAGDFNGDGRHDLLITGGDDETASNPFPARAYVVFGGAEGLLELRRLGEHGFRIRCGKTARPIDGTDFNGDRFSDVVVQSDTHLHVVFGSGVKVQFVRGDSNADGDTNLSDAVKILNHLFLGEGNLSCQDAADTDDDGVLVITDAIYVLSHLFLGGPPPPAPYPDPGVDPTQDLLGCQPVR